MTTPTANVPRWVEPYLPDFRDLLHRLDLTPGFLLQPVVLPSPDLARALADWLAAEGVAVRVFDMRHEPWDELAARLLAVTFDPAEERRAVVVVTPIELDRETARAGLLTLNSVRDTLARTLQCPLLWCGGVSMLRAMADFATDLWSIAATVVRIPIRDFAHAPSRWVSPNLWWTGATQESIEDITTRITAAHARGDTRGALRASLDLAEAQLASHARSDASATLEGLESPIRTTEPMLLPRWIALRGAVDAAGATPDDMIAALRAQIERAHVRGAKHIEAQLYRELARAFATANRHAEAFNALTAAWNVATQVGDDGLTMSIALLLASGYVDRLSDEQIVRIRAHADRLTEEPCPSSMKRDAWLVLAVLAQHAQRWDEVDSAARQALAHSSPDDLGQMVALILRGNLAIVREDWSAALSHNTELLKFALAHDLVVVAMDAYRRRAAAYHALGRHRDACRDLSAARTLAGRIGDHDSEDVFTIQLLLEAHDCGSLEVCLALAPRAYEALLRRDWTLLPRLKSPLHEPEVHELAELVKSVTGEPATLNHVADRLRALADAREQALRARGIDPFDPDTWPTASADPSEPPHP